jgi:preprotein translocase subunit SecE
LSEQNGEKLPLEAAKKTAVPLQRMVEFLQKVKQEMTLVTRPSWKEVRATTLVVLVFVFLFAFYLRLLDWILSPLDRWLFSH